MSYRAIYFDGSTAERQEVIIRFKRRKLDICMLSNRQIASWPFRRLERVEPVGKHFPLRLRCKRKPNARLVLSDESVILVMAERLPRLFKDQHANRGLLHGALTLALFTTTIVAVLFLTIPRLAKPIAQSVPVEWEEEIGKATLHSLTKKWPVCEGEGTRALQELSQRLERVAGVRSTVKIYVVRAKVLNAFAMPGDYMLVTDSLIDFMEGPDELAGVLAHEMGHLVLRHPLEGVLSQMGVALFLNAISGGGSTELVNIGTMIASISYTRDYERQADQLGLKILNRAQISTQGYADLFVRLTEKERKELANASDVLDLNSLLRTHPFASERAQLALRTPTQGSAPSLTPAQWQSITRLCHGQGGSKGTVNGRVDRHEH